MSIPIRKTQGLLVVFAMVLFWVSTSSAANLVAVSNNQVFRIDTVSGATTPIGSISIPCFGIDHASFQNNLYILGSDAPGGSSRIYSVNMTSGSYSSVTVSGTIYRIACRTDGTLAGLTGSQVVLINTSTGATSVIGSASIPYIGASDATAQNMLYVLGADSPGGATKIYKVNMASGGASSITPDVAPTILGVRADGSLVGVTSSQVRLINTSSGSSTLIGSTSIGAFGLSETSIGNTLWIFGASGPGGGSLLYKVNMVTGSTVSGAPSTMPMAIAMLKTPSEQPAQPVNPPIAVPEMNGFGYAAMLLVLPVVGFFAIRKRKYMAGMVFLLAGVVSQKHFG